MPRIIALQPSEVVSVDLGHFSCRIALRATTRRGKPCFSLVYYYAPAQMLAFRPIDGLHVDLAPHAFMPLVQAPVPVTKETIEKDIEPVANASLEGGTPEKDIARMTEAYNLFRNVTRFSEEGLQECIEKSTEVIKAYWSVREWMGAGMKDEKTVTVLESSDSPFRLVLMP